MYDVEYSKEQLENNSLNEKHYCDNKLHDRILLMTKCEK